MKLGMMLPVKPDIKWTLARQIGIEYAVTKAAPELSGQLPPWDFDSLRQTVRRFEEHGFRLYALEGDEFDMGRIKLGLPGRDEDIEHYLVSSIPETKSALIEKNKKALSIGYNY